MEPRLHWEEHPGNDRPCCSCMVSSRAGPSGGENLEPLGAVCRPVVVELWGHGRSPAGGSPHDYSAAGYLEQIEAVRERLAVERWHLCGQSLGASLTLRYSLRFPERVLCQVFTNSNSAFATAGIIEERRRLAAAAIEDIEARGLAAVEDLPVHPRRARRLPPDLYRELVADALRIEPRRDRRFVPASQRRRLGTRGRSHDLRPDHDGVAGATRSASPRTVTTRRQTSRASGSWTCPPATRVNAERHEEFNEVVAAFLRTGAGGGR